MTPSNQNEPQVAATVIEVLGEKPSKRDKFYQELGYREPVDSITKIEEAAKFLAGAVTFSCGALLTAMKIGIELADKKELPIVPWCVVMGLWIASLLWLLLVLLPISDHVRTDSPTELESSFRKSRTKKYRYLVSGTICFVAGLVAGLVAIGMSVN